MDKNHSTAAAGASKKSQWSRNAPKTASVEPASPWAKQENKGVSRVQKRDTRGMERTTVTEAKDHTKLEGESETHSQKVRRPPVVFTVESLSWPATFNGTAGNTASRCILPGNSLDQERFQK